MGFSEDMRDSLGTEGVRIEVSVDEPTVAPGAQLTWTVRLFGGSREATLHSVRIRMIHAARTWLDGDGRPVSDAEAADARTRRHRTPTWALGAFAETIVPVERRLGPAEPTELRFELAVPPDSPRTGDGHASFLNVQADVTGQIDPTANVRIDVA